MSESSSPIEKSKSELGAENGQGNSTKLKKSTGSFVKPKEKGNCDIEYHKYLENQITNLLRTINATDKSFERIKTALDLAGKEREKLLEIIEAQKEQIKMGQLTPTEQEFLKLLPAPLYSAREGEPVENCFG